jgi:TonB family protein
MNSSPSASPAANNSGENPTAHIVELTLNTLQVIRVDSGIVGMSRSAPLDNKAVLDLVLNDASTDWQNSGWKATVATFPPAISWHIVSDDQVRSIGPDPTLGGVAAGLPHGFAGELLVAGCCAGKGAGIEIAGDNRWLIGVTTRESHDKLHAKLERCKLTPSSAGPGVFDHIGGISRLLRATGQSAVALWDLGLDRSHLFLVTPDGVEAVVSCEIRLTEVWEAVRAELNLKYQLAAARLFFGDLFDFTDAAPRVATRLAPALSSAMSALPIRGDKPALACVGLTNTQNWLTSYLASALGCGNWQPDPAAILTEFGLQLGGDLMPGSIGPASLGLLHRAGAAAKGDRNWTPLWQEQTSASSVFALPPAATIVDKPSVPAPVSAAPVPPPPAKQAPIPTPIQLPSQPAMSPAAAARIAPPPPPDKPAVPVSQAPATSAPTVPAPEKQEAAPAPIPASVPPLPPPAAVSPQPPVEPAKPAAEKSVPQSAAAPSKPEAQPQPVAQPPPLAQIAPAAQTAAPQAPETPKQPAAAPKPTPVPVKQSELPKPTAVPPKPIQQAPKQAEATKQPEKAKQEPAKQAAAKPTLVQKKQDAPKQPQAADTAKPAEQPKPGTVKPAPQAAKPVEPIKPAPATTSKEPDKKPLAATPAPKDTSAFVTKKKLPVGLIVGIAAALAIGAGATFFIRKQMEQKARAAQETAAMEQQARQMAEAREAAELQKAKDEAERLKQETERLKQEASKAAQLAEENKKRLLDEAEKARQAQEALARTPGVITISSSPVGAEVAIDGSTNQVAPATFSKVLPGSHKITVSMSGYESVEQLIELNGAQQLDMGTVTLKPIRGSLMIRSDPADAEYSVFPAEQLDGQALRTGRTPGSVDGLPPGNYAIRFTRPGVAPIAEYATIKGKDVVDVTGTFLIGGFVISSTPAGAAVRVNGEFMGVTPISRPDATPGLVTVDLTLQDYEPVKLTGNVSKKDALRLHADMLPIDRVARQNEIKTPAKIQTPVKPVIPPELGTIQGEVVISFVVNKNGVIRDTRVERSSNPSLTEPCLNALAQWKFSPAIGKNGQPVNSRLQIPFKIDVTAPVNATDPASSPSTPPAS